MDRMNRTALVGLILSIVVAVTAVAVIIALLPGDEQAPDVAELTRTVQVRGDESLTIDPFEDLPIDDADSGVESVRITSAPSNGEVRINPDGTLTYIPPAEFIDRDEFAYAISDPAGEPIAAVQVTVNIEEVPDPPGMTSSTAEIDFDEICVWCDESSSIEIAAEEDDVEIEEIRLTGARSDQFALEHDCDGVTLDAGETCEIEVWFEPIRPDLSEAQVEVLHSKSGSPLVIPLNGFGDCERPGGDQLDLLDNATGFGRNATGGAEGCLVRVTSLDDEGEGTLREAAERPGPAWIIFDESGTIELDENIFLEPDKTIDGRGASIVLEEAGLYMIHTPNVVITNIEIRDAHEDGLHILGMETTDIWISHVTIANVVDGYIDITQGATNVTVSWSRFERSPDWPQEKAILVGAGDPGDPDELTHVTLHHNLFDGTDQRHPLLRSGQVHSFNNYFNGWGIYGSGVSANGQLFSERNIYEHNGNEHPDRAFTPWDEAAHGGGDTANIRSAEDRFLGGASGVESNRDDVFSPDYAYSADDPDDNLMDVIREEAGAVES